MQQYEIRVRLASDSTPERVTELAEKVQDFFENNAHAEFLYCAAGPVESVHDDWANTAQNNLNELMD